MTVFSPAWAAKANNEAPQASGISRAHEIDFIEPSDAKRSRESARNADLELPFHPGQLINFGQANNLLLIHLTVVDPCVHTTREVGGCLHQVLAV
jgi:hypothetical protein